MIIIVTAHISLVNLFKRFIDTIFTFVMWQHEELDPVRVQGRCIFCIDPLRKVGIVVEFGPVVN
jgi:hypothetical protein